MTAPITKRSIEENTQIIIDGLNFYNARLEALEARLVPKGLPSRVPDAAVIEIVERRNTPLGGPGVIVPNEVRINGIPILCADKPVTVTSGTDAVLVTLTLFARHVVIGEEIV